MIGLSAVPAFIPVATQTVTTYLTGTSGSNQTYNVPATFVSNVSVEVVSAGGNGINEQTDGCGNGNGDQASGGTGGYAIKSGVTMVAGGTQTYRLRAAGAGSGSTNACWFGGTTLSGSVVGIECGANGVNGGDGAGASTTGGKGDTVTGGSTTAHDAGQGAPPAAAQTARSGSGVTTAGDGGGTSGGAGSGGGQAIIKIVNILTA